MRRYDFLPLERLLLVQIGPQLTDTGQHAGKPRLLAEALGTSREQVIRWRQYGVDAAQADRLAGRAGFVVYEVWPEWLEDVGRRCDQCGERFVPVRKDGRFCNPLCRKQWWNRNFRPPERRAELERQRYWSDEAKRERAKERARQYHDAYRDHLNAQRRLRRKKRDPVQHKNGENPQVNGNVSRQTGDNVPRHASEPVESMERMENVA